MFGFLRRNWVLLQDILIFVLFFLYFRTNLIWIFTYFFQAASYEYLFLLVVSIFFFFYAARGQWKFKPERKLGWDIIFPLFLVVSGDMINVLFLHYQIVSACLFIFGIYILLGMYLEKSFWHRGAFLVFLVALSLPFAEHIQTFVGFPLRLITAKMVSLVMGVFGVLNINDAAIIVIENNVTSIDVPCSGVKSMYTGLIVLLIVFFIKRPKFSFKMFGVVLSYFVLLFLFNFWRVFSLIYIYDVVNFVEFGDSIHVGIGLVGVVASTYLLWLMVGKFLVGEETVNSKKTEKTQQIRKIYVVGVLIMALLIDFSYMFLSSARGVGGSRDEASIDLNIESVNLKEVSFGEQEKEFFERRDVQFAKKYIGQLASKQEFSLLIVASNSWKTHHNPEFCIQGIGHSIDSSRIIQVQDSRVRKLELNGGKDTVLYWFFNGDRVLTDYSERVWEGVLNPQQTWVLVEIGFKKQAGLDGSKVGALIPDLNSALELSFPLLPSV